MPKKKQTLRADKRFEYKLTLGKDVHGKLIRKSFYSTESLADAKAQAKEFEILQEVSARTGEAFIQAKYNFAQWAEKWLLIYKKPFVGFNTYETYRVIVEHHILPYFGTVELTDIRPVDVQTFAASKKQLSDSHLKKIRLCLSDIFVTAIENDLCFKNPVRRVQFMSDAQKHEKRVLTVEQIEIVTKAALTDFPAAAVLLDSGMRRGELLGLMWSDLTLEHGSGAINVQRAVSSEHGKLVLHPPKKNSFRVVPISNRTVDLFLSLPQTSLYVFPSKTGSVMDVDHFSKRLKAFMTSLQETHPDIPLLTSHEMRHTYGTDLRRRGVDIYTIQKILGHKNIKMTTEIYVHNELDQLRTALFPKATDEQQVEQK